LVLLQCAWDDCLVSDIIYNEWVLWQLKSRF
jgi:hypothetical protein